MDYLAVIDSDQWPAVATVPQGLVVSARARVAEARFAMACTKAGINVGLTHDADLIVAHGELFHRIAAYGWTGVAEGYLAGEWTAKDLVAVLSKLISSGYRPVSTPATRVQDSGVGELSPELVRLSSGDGMSASVGRFASGVSTTVRTHVPSFAPRSSTTAEPQHHFVDVTTVDKPIDVEPADLGDGQRRAVAAVLDAAGVGKGTHVVEFPSSGGSVAIEAASRRATVDVLTGDVGYAEEIKERVTLAGVSENVHTVVRDSVFQGARDWRARYDAVVAMERLETLSPKQRVTYMRAVDRLLDVDGSAAMQALVATDEMTKAGQDALKVLRSYIWPGLEHPKVMDVHRLVDKHTNLRLIGVDHFGDHARLSLKFQREVAAGKSREIAAEGFDAVYRRLWEYQLALREALLGLGMLDAVTMTFKHRHRGGRR